LAEDKEVNHKDGRKCRGVRPKETYLGGKELHDAKGGGSHKTDVRQSSNCVNRGEARKKTRRKIPPIIIKAGGGEQEGNDEDRKDNGENGFHST